MFSKVYVYAVNRSKDDKKCLKCSCLNCNISFKYFIRKQVKTYKPNDFNISQVYRVKGKYNSIILVLSYIYFFVSIFEKVFA